MPSPTSNTSPTSFGSILSRYRLISSVRTETISLALMRMDVAAFLDELIADSFQTRPHAAVVHPIVHFDHQTTQQIRIDADSQDRLAIELLAQLAAQAFTLFIVQGNGGRGLHVYASGSALVNVAHQHGRLAENAETIMVVKDEQKVIENLVDLALEGAAQRISFLLAADDGAGEEDGESRIAGKDIANQLLQLLQHFLRLLPFVGGGQERLGIDAGHVPGGVVENGGVMDLLAVSHVGSIRRAGSRKCPEFGRTRGTYATPLACLEYIVHTRAVSGRPLPIWRSSASASSTNWR